MNVKHRPLGSDPYSLSLSVPDPLLVFCKATADKVRLDILRVLSRDSFGVLELVEIFDSKQSGISHHLKILSDAGLVLKHREGNSIYYRRSHNALSIELLAIQKQLFIALEQYPLSVAILERVSDIHQKRATKAVAFFKDNADKFAQQQEQVAAYELYGPNAEELILSTKSTSEKVLEIGPGEGQFLPILSKQYQQVFALDNSVEMLNKAESFVSSKKLTNIEFIHSDTTDLSLAQLGVGTVVMNMVLHHVPSPVEVIFDISKILQPGGNLFITELCSHDQSWVKESCGDLWLGFDPVELSDWLEEANFSEGKSVYLAQRNGFRVQIRQFIRN